MKKQVILAGLLAATLAMPLAACGGSSAGTSTSGDSGTPAASAAKGDFDANETYVGQWRGYVEMTGQTVYGTAGGTEPMLDVNFAEDGTVTVEPLEAHADLLNDKGTWEGTADEVTLHLDKAGDIKLTSAGKDKLEGDAHAFDIADFDTIKFDFYG